MHAERIHNVAAIDDSEVSGEQADLAESRLVQASRDGDQAAFSALYEHYRRGIYRLCMRRLRGPLLAEDAAQETFTKAFAAISTFEPGRPIWPWLATIADNHCIDILRRSGRSTPSEGLGEEQASTLEEDEESIKDPTGYAVVKAERWQEIADALRTLPTRQRRALLLHALEGWNYADIATAEQASVSSVKSLIFRARRYLRQTCEFGPLGLILFPWRSLRRMIEDAAARARQTVGGSFEGVFVGAGQTLFNAVLALSVLISTGPALAVSESAAPESRIQLAADGHPGHEVSAPLPPISPSAITSNANPSDPPVHEDAARFVNDYLIDPGDGATPEETRFTSIVASPSYEQDGTLLAAGEVGCLRPPCSVLFASHDGGDIWEQLEGANFAGRWLLLPPSYPEDPRIFAMGPTGLQQSTDGGASFETLTPLSGRAAIAPTFNAGDPRILIGGATVSEYWADRGIVRPAALLAQSNLVSDVAFSPSYSIRDPVIVVGAERLGADEPIYRSIVYRCEGSICSESVLPDSSGMPVVKLSPRFAQDGVAFAFTGFGAFRSTDGARTFMRIDLPPPLRGGLMDLEILYSKGLWGGTLFVGGLTSSGQGLHVSHDRGETWEPVSLGLSGFTGGVTHLRATPTGGIYVASADAGIACSTDGGRSWSKRCNLR